ncbi:MAG: hypothetical protein GXY20_08825 [Clostridiales bacterium]|nr:hypothetical protein [Clostridiales bacterium]
MDELKYNSMFFELKPQYTEWGSWCHSPQLYFRGSDQIPGARYNVGWQIFTDVPTGWAEKWPHFHREEEYLVFINADLFHCEEFDAEIVLWMGEDVDNMEKHVITRPTIVRIPGSMWHCPLEFIRIGKPILFQAAYLDGTCGRVSRIDDEEGSAKFVYMGNEINSRRSCRLEPGKKCTMCGKCTRLAYEEQLKKESKPL